MVHVANGHPAALDKMHSQHLHGSSLPFMAILKQEAATRAASSSACRAWAKRAASGTAAASAELCQGGMLVFVIRGTATPYEWTLGEADGAALRAYALAHATCMIVFSFCSRGRASRALFSSLVNQSAGNSRSAVKKHECEVSMTSPSGFCWPADYTYKTREDPNYGPGRFHEGFLAVANQLWEGGMKEALDAALAAGDVQHVIITGHSLGGASTTLLSARAQVGEDSNRTARDTAT